MSNRASASRPIVTVLCALLLIGLAYWSWHVFHKPTPAPSISSSVIPGSSLAVGRAPASIRSAVLYDCYEHARENVPPRNDTSARANNWRPPPMPLETARAAITDKNSPDGALLTWLENWDADYRSGKPTLDQSRLISILNQTHLGFEPLFNIGAAMGFLESRPVAAIFHRAALRRAAEEYKNLSPLHPAAPMLRAALPQMGMYWGNNDYELLEQRFKLEMQLYPPLSQEARKCAHSCAEAMFYQGKPQAADLMADKVQCDEQAGDLSASDKQEMGWIVGIFYREDRAKEAIAGLIVATQSGGTRGNDALRVIGYKLLSIPPPEMDAQLASLEKKLSAEQFQTLQRYVEQSRIQRGIPVNRPTTMTSAEAMAARRRAQIAATQPTTQRVLTTQQAAMLAARRAALATRPAAPTTAQINADRLAQQREIQLMRDQQRAATENLVPEMRALLKSKPRQAVDQLLNRGGLQRLLQAQRYDEVEELTVAAIIAAARDTWQVEQLQQIRVAAFYGHGQSQTALSAAHALFNVAGMGSVPGNLATFGQSLAAANPSDPAILHHFRLQQLAGAQQDAQQRKDVLDKLGKNILTSITIDPSPFAQTIKDRQSAADYDSLYALGNLLLVSGRIAEAREVFEKVYKIAPPAEVNYASEAIAKVIKAEDGTIGRANEFAAAIRPKE